MSNLNKNVIKCVCMYVTKKLSVSLAFIVQGLLSLSIDNLVSQMSEIITYFIYYYNLNFFINTKSYKHSSKIFETTSKVKHTRECGKCEHFGMPNTFSNSVLKLILFSPETTFCIPFSNTLLVLLTLLPPL